MIYGYLSGICANITNLVFIEVSDYIGEYDVTLDVCLSSTNQQSYELNRLVSLFCLFFLTVVVLLFIFFYLPSSIMYQETRKMDLCLNDKAVTYLNRCSIGERLTEGGEGSLVNPNLPPTKYLAAIKCP